jgi:hypothetical protein
MSLNSVNQLIFVMMKCGVFFAVRTEFLYIISTSFGFNGLRDDLPHSSVPLLVDGMTAVLRRDSESQIHRCCRRFLFCSSFSFFFSEDV